MLSPSVLHSDAHSHAHAHTMSSVSVSRLLLEASMDSAPIENGRVRDWRLSDDEFLSAFSLPGLAEKYATLKELNPLPRRDARISFN